MHRKLTLIALSIGFIGAVLSFLGVWRIEHMFTDEGVSLGWGKGWSGFLWHACTPVGIALVALSFAIEFFAILLYQPAHGPHPSGQPDQESSSARLRVPQPVEHHPQTTDQKADESHKPDA